MQFQNRLKASLVCGAIGDAIGGRYEGTETNVIVNFDFPWSISDDTQLTLATCEAICTSSRVNPEKVANTFLEWYNKGKLTGLGSSTLGALRGLQVGGHWALVGATGEYASGNGAAMRIAPLAFKKNIDLLTVRDICSITHKNDEAYIGALSIFHTIHNCLHNAWNEETDIISSLIGILPDTRVRDRFIEISNLQDCTITELGKKFRPTGYVVDSVPIAIFAAQKIHHQNYKSIITELVTIGGDTDTTCSMTGQIIGAIKGMESIPDDWINKYNNLKIKPLIDKITSSWRS